LGLPIASCYALFTLKTELTFMTVAEVNRH
jgi:hypothetical protein